FRAAVRWVGRIRGTQIDVKILRRRNSGWIAVVVARVVCAVSGYIGATRRLGILPDFGESDAALGWVRCACGHGASGRGRAGVVCDPVCDIALAGVGADVFGGDYVSIFCVRHPRAVDADAESGSGYGVYPRIDVGLLLVEHASTLLYI